MVCAASGTAVVDCAALSTSCVVHADHYVVLCEHGEYRYVDCTALGFGGCAQAGAAPAISASCTP